MQEASRRLSGIERSSRAGLMNHLKPSLRLFFVATTWEGDEEKMRCADLAPSLTSAYNSM
ncbi:hypothetical protein CIHG_06453 [Coccidioides immitis H538.4]|uniref:Orange domain-containing protein n=3 Tax=Coccidioides immitis TaxID=5501 RepID=A0A0J8TSH2_COCIT|nr:hypothetical protein CIRG_10267 [Coccidioides immitis RMSCC 2394]KMU76712.1 hypothetical protein CISG_05855 [Coccidioides immitis RMSCC 3703]KMU88785.1 hypothetical protein CIHG_06453 [Coccidioides immitis H538.4]